MSAEQEIDKLIGELEGGSGLEFVRAEIWENSEGIAYLAILNFSRGGDTLITDCFHFFPSGDGTWALGKKLEFTDKGEPMSDVKRFTRESPCPICGGSPSDPRGQGIRCAGYWLADETAVVCMRRADGAVKEIETPVGIGYLHRLSVRNCPMNVATGKPVRRTVERLPGLTDSGNAEFFAQLYAGRLLFDNLRGRWLVWGNHWWNEDDNQTVKRFAIEAARLRQKQAAGIEDADLKKKTFGFCVSSENRFKIESTLNLAQCQPEIIDSGKTWDADPMLLGVSNGVLNLTTGKLYSGQQADRISLHLNIPFIEGAKAPRWEKFLEEVFEENSEVISFVKRAVGYSLTGNFSEEAIFFLHGIGANGKSSFLRALQYVLGPYSFSLPFSVFEVSHRQGSSTSTEFAHLDRKRVLVVSEVRSDARLHEAKLKDLSSGDKQTARFLYREPFEFTPVCKIWLAGNSRPRVVDDSDAFWRRLYLLPFLKQFRGAAADPDLYRKLQAEAAGILFWAIQGCLNWQENRLSPPDYIRSAVKDYRLENDPSSEFFSDRCNFENKKAEIKALEFYHDYKKWGKKQGFEENELLSLQSFARRVGERCRRKRTGEGTIYIGVELKPELEQRQKNEE